MSGPALRCSFASASASVSVSASATSRLWKCGYTPSFEGFQILLSAQEMGIIARKPYQPSLQTYLEVADRPEKHVGTLDVLSFYLFRSGVGNVQPKAV